MEPKPNEDEAKMLYRLRKAGYLPLINILGKEFWVDWGMMELAAVDDASNTIDLMRCPKAPDADGYLVRFCPRDGEGFWPGKKRYDDPTQILYLVKIPHENILDPYLVAKQRGENLKEFLKRYPISLKLDAEQYFGSRTNVMNVQVEDIPHLSKTQTSAEKPDTESTVNKGLRR